MNQHDQMQHDEERLEQLLEVSGKVYELCLSGKFYEDHDKSTGLLGELRAAIRAAEAEKARGRGLWTTK